MGKAFLVGVVVVLGAACIADSGLEAGGLRLVHGHEEGSPEAIGLVEIGIGQCSGTLVAPRIVLTAKHCFPAGDALPAIRFLVGPRGETEAGVGVAVFHRSPRQGYRRQSDDLVAIVLDRDASVPFIPPRRSPLSGDDEGASVLLAGYGMTAEAGRDVGVRRAGPAILDDVGRKEIETVRTGTQATSCNGDSGGAVILGGELAGVIVGSVGRNCGDTTIATRVDVYGDVLDQAYAEVARGAVAPSPPAPAPADGEGAGGEEPADPVTTNVGCAADLCLDGDGWCDEEFECCAFDADCHAPLPEEPDDGDEAPFVCDCDLTWGCDDCWCEPADECP